ncbi:hypothetical protein K501DRAFT_213257 [Backusella circina FSU 941]|nr:hypothetical protein K501DRAFT_213257 [Backusella circina FSU 941]
MDIKRIPHRLLPTTLYTPPEEEDFYESLSKYSTLYRILLFKPCINEVYLNQWNRLDLQLVNELGLPLRGAKERECYLQVDAELLLQQGKRIVSSGATQFTIQTRPIQRDAWDFFDDPSAISGFQHNTRGGLEYKVSLDMKHSMVRDQTCYLKVNPVVNGGSKDENRVAGQPTVRAFPLVIGPFVVKPESASQKEVDLYQKDWSSKCFAQDSFHVFHMLDKSYLMIKEIWHLGTPGKMWDSAIVLSQMFTEMIHANPARFHKKRILDLSAGTGCVGLVIAATYKRIFPQYKPEVIMTDLKEALDLLEYNRKINHLDNPKTLIKPLKWGESKDVQLILKGGPIDFVIASDVLYEPAHFSALVSTLDHLVGHQKTCIYLGYKKRGLSLEQESTFFNICLLKFDIVLIQDEQLESAAYVDGWIGGEGGFSTILKETGVEIYRLSRKESIL